MAIEVLGKDAGVAKTTTCRNCGSILKYYLVDVKSYTSTDYTGGSDTYHYISCPVCQDKVHVKGY